MLLGFTETERSLNSWNQQYFTHITLEGHLQGREDTRGEGRALVGVFRGQNPQFQIIQNILRFIRLGKFLETIKDYLAGCICPSSLSTGSWPRLILEPVQPRQVNRLLLIGKVSFTDVQEHQIHSFHLQKGMKLEADVKAN